MSTIISTVDVKHGYEVKRTWRIISTDNFGGDYPDESFIAIDIKDELTAEAMAKPFNSDQSSRFYRVVEHVEIVYKLVPGFEL